MNKHIGIFSGTFDPVHVGHVEVCLVAKAACELDEVLVFVEKNPKHKNGVASYKDRLKMTELALQDFKTIKVVDHEFERINFRSTQKYLNENNPSYKPVLIIGSDLVKNLESWDEAEAIFKNMQLCVFLRELKEENEIEQQLNSLNKKYDARFILCPPVWSTVSSSIVKSEIKKYGGSELIHKKVQEYIKDKKLYV